MIIIKGFNGQCTTITKIVMNETKNLGSEGIKVKVLNDSVKFYLPRVEGYLQVVRNMASKYGGMSLMEFDGYFEGKFEPVKYVRAEIHTNNIDEKRMIKFANKIRLKLKQTSLAIEYNNRLLLITAN
jgi:hypothetical protein